MGSDLVDKVKSVVKYMVLFIFTHQSCAQLDRMLVAYWSCILTVFLCYIGLSRLHTLRTSPGMKIS